MSGKNAAALSRQQKKLPCGLFLEACISSTPQPHILILLVFPETMRIRHLGIRQAYFLKAIVILDNLDIV